MSRIFYPVSKVFSLNDIICACLNSPECVRLKGYHPRVTFRCTLGKDLLNVKGSPVHLSKTVMNLISNAAEAIADRGEVTIVTETQRLGAGAYVRKPYILEKIGLAVRNELDRPSDET